MFVISKRVERIVCRKTGLTMAQIADMSIKDEMELVKQKRGRVLSFSKVRDMRKIGRGNPLLARKRIRTMDYVNKRLDEICKE